MNYNDIICNDIYIFMQKMNGVNNTISMVYTTFLDTRRTNGSKIAVNYSS